MSEGREANNECGNRKSKIKNKKGRLRLTATPAASPSTHLFVITRKCSMELFLQKKMGGRKKNLPGMGRGEFLEMKSRVGFHPGPALSGIIWL